MIRASSPWKLATGPDGREVGPHPEKGLIVSVWQTRFRVLPRAEVVPTGNNRALSARRDLIVSAIGGRSSAHSLCMT